MASITQLQYVVAVDTYRHFALAAEKCFVSQPTLSMQIKKLENELDVILFDRSKQPVIPTDIGVKIIEQARTVLKEENKIQEIIKQHNNEISGNLIIGIIPTLATSLIPRFLGSFTKRFPQVSLDIREMKTDAILSDLKADIIDVGILVTPIPHDSLKSTPLFWEEIKLYVNKSNDLYKKEEVKIEELGNDNLWLLSSGNCFQSQVINLCASREQSIGKSKFTYQSNSFETLIRMVDKEGGYTLLPELTIIDLPANKSNQIKGFNNFTPLREISTIAARNFTKTRLIDSLNNCIKDNVSPVMHYKERGQIVEWK
ncbi:MAG: LysR substrate-binding domain-containing protein [Flavobacteriales bacterium]